MSHANSDMLLEKAIEIMEKCHPDPIIIEDEDGGEITHGESDLADRVLEYYDTNRVTWRNRIKWFILRRQEQWQRIRDRITFSWRKRAFLRNLTDNIQSLQMDRLSVHHPEHAKLGTLPKEPDYAKRQHHAVSRRKSTGRYLPNACASISVRMDGAKLPKKPSPLHPLSSFDTLIKIAKSNDDAETIGILECAKERLKTLLVARTTDRLKMFLHLEKSNVEDVICKAATPFEVDSSQVVLKNAEGTILDRHKSLFACGIKPGALLELSKV